jgi:hypothetical protein
MRWSDQILGLDSSSEFILEPLGSELKVSATEDDHALAVLSDAVIGRVNQAIDDFIAQLAEAREHYLIED